jgi:hypothetical protein
VSKRRRVEVTTFRRRITIVLREKLELSPSERPSGEGDETRWILTDPAKLEVLDLGRSQAAQGDNAVRSGLKLGFLRRKLRGLLVLLREKKSFGVR